MRLILLLCACATFAFTSRATLTSVVSTNDGNGLFSYTFNLGTDPFVWGISSNNGFILIQSHQILDLYSPAGWTANADGNELITWTYTGPDTVFLGETPLTFSVLSFSTIPVLYDESTNVTSYLQGIVAGGAYSYPDHVSEAGGYETFSFIGPAVPEPSTGLLVGAGAAAAVWLRIRRRNQDLPRR